MKLKNVLLMGLSLVLVAALAIGGTVAYLTDTDSDVNVMTLGNVQVKLQEKQRSEDGSKLVDFVQGQVLTPLVGSAQGAKDQWGQPSRDQASNYVDKIVYATNTGKNDAYIRFLVAIPTALIPDPENDQAPLHWNFGNRVDITGTGKYNDVAYAGSDWAKLFKYADVTADGKAAAVTIDGEEYWVTCFTMQETLAPGADSLAVMAGLYLDNRVDYDADRGVYTFNGVDINYDLSKGVKIPVMVQAVQADGFKTADDALTSAYGEVTVANAESWFGKIHVEVGDDDNPAINDKNVAGVQTTGGTYDSLTVIDNTEDYKDGGKYFRALYGSGITEDLTVNNSYLQGLYAMNVTAKSGSNAKLSATNTTFDGWVSYSYWDSATFTNCTFIGEKTHSDYAEEWVMSTCRVQTYDDTTFTNCNFGENFAISRNNKEAITITINNCYKEGVKITAENFNDLLNNKELNGNYCIKSTNNVTVIVDGITVTLPTA